MSRLLLVLLLATPLLADNNYVAQEWQKKIEASSAALKKGDHARSLRLANRLITDMIEKLGPGRTETHTFAVVVVHKALASAGLGKLDDARWYWHVAVGIEPALAKVDLSPFGEAGKLVSAIPLRKPENPDRTNAKPLTPDMVAPKAVKTVDPIFPLAAHVFKVSGVLVLEVVITTDGDVVDPAILEPLPAPTLSYVALEAVRRWKFEPGKMDGEAVDVIFNLSVNYKLR
jgi:TonB family protein